MLEFALSLSLLPHTLDASLNLIDFTRMQSGRSGVHVPNGTTNQDNTQAICPQQSIQQPIVVLLLGNQIHWYTFTSLALLLFYRSCSSIALIVWAPLPLQVFPTSR